MRREQKKGYVARLKKAAHLRKSRKRRIIHDDASFRIIVMLVIAARPEGPHDFPPLDIGIFPQPSKDSIVNRLWRVAIVRCLWGLEFRHKTVIILVYLPPRFTSRRIPPWFIGEQRTLYIHVVNHRNILCFWRMQQDSNLRPTLGYAGIATLCFPISVPCIALTAELRTLNVYSSHSTRTVVIYVENFSPYFIASSSVSKVSTIWYCSLLYTFTHARCLTRAITRS